MAVRGGSWGCVEPECWSVGRRSNWLRADSILGIGFHCARTPRGDYLATPAIVF
ncbi:MAG: hypothetical protein JW751_28240 [Polyangiaceae bacterium]|nr:hypothetical protein [Polyangiaceae bacterium]